MKRLIFILAMSLCFLGCDKTEHTHAEGADRDHAHDAACVCADGKKGGTVWCDTCGAGYIKGEKTKEKKAVTAALAAKTAPAAAEKKAEAKPAAAEKKAEAKPAAAEKKAEAKPAATEKKAEAKPAAADKKK